MSALRIAVADDEADMREYFGKILPRLGHEVVVVAATGSELVAKCREARPDLVITDIKMPDMDGLAAVAEIRRDLSVKVLIVSGYGDRRTRARAEEAQVSGYLLKPIKRADLAAGIEAAMNG